jgi:hypothetical protein
MTDLMVQPPLTPTSKATATSPTASPMTRWPLYVSFKMLGQHLFLIYPLLLLLMLIDAMRPQELLIGDWRILVFLGLLFLLQTAFTTGWLAMQGQSVLQIKHKWLAPTVGTASQSAEAKASGQASSPTVALFRGFHVFKCFIPAVGKYFLPILIGNSIYAVLLTAAIAGVTVLLWPVVMPHAPSVADLSGLSAKIGSIAQAPDMLEQLKAFPLADKQLLDQLMLLMLAGMVVSLLLAGLTQFWGLFVILLQNNPFKAFVRSVGFTFRRAFPLLGSLIVFALLSGLTMFLQISPLPLLSLMGAFVSMVLYLWWQLYIACTFVQHYPAADLALQGSSTPPISDGVTGGDAGPSSNN